MRSCGDRRPSVCPSVNILRKSLLLPGKWLDRQTGLHPGCAQGQGGGQRSRDTGTLMSKPRNELLRH